MSACPYGFWVRGSKYSARELVVASRAFEGFAACDERAGTNAENYLSAFTFGEDFRRYVASTGSTAGFVGVCGADHIWFDIDRGDDIDAALADARALVLHLVDVWRVPEPSILVFLSGNKGFHLGIPTALWAPEPSVLFNRAAIRFAGELAGGAGGGGVSFDRGVFDKVRLFRAPNSRHPKTGLRKRVFSPDELLGLTIERIADLAREPLAFDVPQPTGRNDLLAAAWNKATAEVAVEDEALKRRAAEVSAAGGPERLNQLTIEFIRVGALTGGPGTPPEAGRHNRLYAAAINLGEFGCTPRLAHALLTEPALDCGITPSEVRRTIENALRNSVKGKDSNG